MNINVFCRIVSTSQCVTSSFCTSRLPYTYSERVSTKDIYVKELAQDVQLFYNGMNVSFIVMGGHLSSKYTTVFGTHGGRDGILSLFVEQLFFCGRRKCFSEKVSVSFFEVDDAEVVDIFNNKSCCQLKETPDEGVNVLNLCTISIPNAWTLMEVIGRNLCKLDKNRITFIQVTLEKPRQRGVLATKSKFTVVIVPALLPSCNDVKPDCPPKSGNTLTQSLICFNKVIKSLAAQQDCTANFEKNKFLMLMRDILNGNSKTSALLCIKLSSNVNAELVDFAKHLANIQTCPIVNTEFSRRLICRYRSHILALKGCNLKSEEKAGECEKYVEDRLIHNLAGDSILQSKYSSDCWQACMPCTCDSRPCKCVNRPYQSYPGSYRCMNIDYFSEEGRRLLCDEKPVCLEEAEKISMMNVVSTLRFENERLQDEKGAVQHQFYVDKKFLECRLKTLEQEVEQNCALLNVERQKNLVLEADWMEVGHRLEVLSGRHNSLIKAYKCQVERLEVQRRILQNVVDFPCSNIMLITGQLRDTNEEINQILCEAAPQLNCINEYEQRCPTPISCPTKTFENSQIPISVHEKMQNSFQDYIQSLNQELIGSKAINRDLQKSMSRLAARLVILEKEKLQAIIESKHIHNRLKEVIHRFKLKVICYVKDRFSNVPSPSDLQLAMDDLKSCYTEKEADLTFEVSAARHTYQELVARHERLLAAYKDLYYQMKQNNMTDMVDLGLIEEYLKIPSCVSNPMENECEKITETVSCKDSTRHTQLPHQQTSADKRECIKKEIEDIQERVNKGLAMLRSSRTCTNPLAPNNLPSACLKKSKRVFFRDDVIVHGNECPDDFHPPMLPCYDVCNNNLASIFDTTKS